MNKNETKHAEMAKQKKKEKKETKSVAKSSDNTTTTNNNEECWPTLKSGATSDTPFVVFSTMYTTSFVLELVENWTDMHAATFFLIFLGLFLTTGHRLSVYLMFIATATIYEMIWRFPDVPNHVNLAIYMNTLQIVVACCLSRTTSRTTQVGSKRTTLPPFNDGRRRLDFYRAIRPMLGLSMFLTYFFAGFHKLNTDFFDHRVSCTNEFMKNIMQFYKMTIVIPKFDPSESFVMMVSIVTVLWELGGAFALFFQRTQPYMILYSIMMHLILAPCSFYDFSTMMFACFALFMPPTYWKVYEDDKDLVLLPVLGWKIPRHVLYATSAIFVGLTTWQYRPESRQEGQFREIQFRAGQICCLSFLVLSWPIWKSLLLGKLPPWQSFRWMIRPWHSVVWVVPIYALFVIHGMSNYLGLRTAGTFSMFSNLRTEGARSNHFLLGANPIKFWNFQDDIVYINEAMMYRGTIDNRQTIVKDVGYPLVEFQKKLLEWRTYAPFPIYIYFSYNEQCFESLDIAHDENWVVERNWRHYLMDFRKIQLDDDPNRCRW